MKKFFCFLFALLMLGMTACDTQFLQKIAGNQTSDENDTSNSSSISLPEACQEWADAAEKCGVYTIKNITAPMAERAKDGIISEFYGVTMPDGTYLNLALKPFDEGISIEDFSKNGAKRGTSEIVVWDGEGYYAFTVEANNCNLPNLSSVSGGILLLKISGDCYIDGGGSEKACFENFDSVVITGDGTLTIENTSGIGSGGRDLPLPALIITDGITLTCDRITTTSNKDYSLNVAMLGGTLIAEDVFFNNGELLVAGGEVLLRNLFDVSKLTFRDGTSFIDRINCENTVIVMSGGKAYFGDALPSTVTVEGGAGTLSASGIPAVTINDYGAEILDSEKNSSLYYQTIFDNSWGKFDGAQWNSKSINNIDGKYYFGGVMKLKECTASNVLPWGSLWLELVGKNTLKEAIGGESIVFSGEGELNTPKFNVWSTVHSPIVAVLDSCSVNVTGGEEVGIGSNSKETGLFLVDGGSFTCNGNLWLQNSSLTLRGGTLHIKGDCNIECGSIDISGGTLILDKNCWIGKGNVNISGGTVIIKGGVDAICADDGQISVTGGEVREP